jgi:hypothetical protein
MLRFFNDQFEARGMGQAIDEHGDVLLPESDFMIGVMEIIIGQRDGKVEIPPEAEFMFVCDDTMEGFYIVPRVV